MFRTLTFVIVTIAFSAYFHVWFVVHALCAAFVIGYVVGAFVLTVAVIALPFLVARKLARRFLRERWEARYVRLSFDVAVVGIYLLTWTTVFACSMSSPQVLLDAEERSSWPKSFEDSANRLIILTMLAHFLDYFPFFVILPTGVCFLTGYNASRAEQAKKYVNR